MNVKYESLKGYILLAWSDIHNMWEICKVWKPENKRRNKNENILHTCMAVAVKHGEQWYKKNYHTMSLVWNLQSRAYTKYEKDMSKSRAPIHAQKAKSRNETQDRWRGREERKENKYMECKDGGKYKLIHKAHKSTTKSRGEKTPKWYVQESQKERKERGWKE